MDKRIEQKMLTIAKRRSQTCKVFELKIDYSSLSNATIKNIESLFREAKWFYNYCISLGELNDANTTLKSVPVKVKEKFEERILSTLSGQMKQSIKARAFGSLMTLNSTKNNGNKVGKLKFKSEVNSIPLKQYRATFDIDFNKKRIRIQKIKQWLKICGLGQLNGLEIANATLVKKASGYYFHVTTFGPKDTTVVPETSVGIDFGCETQLTLSDGTKVEFQVPVSKRLKKLDKKIRRKQHTGQFREDSKKKRQDSTKRRKEYEKITNQKKDIRNKIVNAITKNFKYVCFQDESIHAWASGGHGKKIQNSSIGGIIADLKNKAHTPIEVDKMFPSTQLCPECGKKNKPLLSDRVYSCLCGYNKDRDIKSALCIETEGLKQKLIPTERRDFKAQERSASTCFDTLNKIHGIKISKLNSMNAERL